jgi:hypothetical protein
MKADVFLNFNIEIKADISLNFYIKTKNFWKLKLIYDRR